MCAIYLDNRMIEAQKHDKLKEKIKEIKQKQEEIIANSSNPGSSAKLLIENSAR